MKFEPGVIKRRKHLFWTSNPDTLGHSQLLENAKLQDLPGSLPPGPTGGLTVPPGSQLVLAMTIANSPTYQQFHTGLLNFAVPYPKILITHPTDELPMKNLLKNLLPVGALLRGVTGNKYT